MNRLERFIRQHGESERILFEIECSNYKLNRDACGEYVHRPVQYMWEGWLSSACEKQSEISRLQAENERLNVCVKYWYESTVKLIDKSHEFEDQLRTVEQRVARECCEIVDKQETFSVQTATNCEMDGFVDKEETVAAIKAKYHLED